MNTLEFHKTFGIWIFKKLKAELELAITLTNIKKVRVGGFQLGLLGLGKAQWVWLRVRFGEVQTLTLTHTLTH